MFLIPDWLVWSSMFYLSFTAIVTSRHGVLLDPIYFIIFIPQGIMYLVFDLIDLPVFERAMWVRVSLFIVPLCFALILNLKYWKKIRHV